MRTELLKTSVRRTVTREQHGAGPTARSVIVKRYHGPDLADRFRDRLRARREYELQKHCHALGLAVPQALELRKAADGWSVVSEDLGHALSLSAYLVARRDGRSTDAAGLSHRRRERWKRDRHIVRSLARLLAEIAAAGLDHGDLHPGNLLIDEQELWLIDLGKSRLRRRLARAVIERNLIQLNAGVRELVSSGVRKRFFVRYLRELPGALRKALGDRARLGRRIEDRGRAYRRSDMLRRSRRWLRPSSSVSAFRDELQSGFLRADLPPELPARLAATLRTTVDEPGRTLLEVRALGAPRPQALERDPDLRASLRASTRGPSVSESPLDSRAADHQRLVRCISERPARELRALWTTQVRLFTHGIACLAPLALANERRHWVAFEVPDGARSLSEPPRDAARRTALCGAFGTLLGSLHDRGLDIDGLAPEELYVLGSGSLACGVGHVLCDLAAPSRWTNIDRFRSWLGGLRSADASALSSAYVAAQQHSDAERERLLAELDRG